jgi:GTP-binding protein HflX
MTGEGIPMLLTAIGERLQRKMVHGLVALKPTQGRQRAKLFDLGAVLREEACDDGGWKLELKLAESDLHRFLKREKLPADLLEPLPVQETA